MAIGSSIPIDLLCNSMGYIYKGYDFTSDSLDNLKLTEKLTKELYKACSNAAEDLMQIDVTLRNTGRAKKLLDCIIESLKLCKKYEDKNKIKKFINSKSDKKRFFYQRLKLYIYFVDLTQSALLTKKHTNSMIEIE